MWFQDQFEYSLEVRPGHGNSAIEAFLRDRIGYCEQFAGTYAAMLRTLGIPSRVAVGFTSGVPVGEGEFSVLGRNAHAWPEVWFDDIGWIAFEPTPGRGAPNAQSYTRLDPQQDTSAAPSDIQSDGGPPVTVDAAPTDPGPGLEIPDFSDDSTRETPTSAPRGAGDDDGVQWQWLIGLAVMGAAIAAPSVIRDIRRRRSSQSVDQQIAGAWQRATGAVAAAGVPLRASDTPTEVAARTARRLPWINRPMSSLAEAVTEATYREEGTAGYDSAGAYGESTVNDCRNWAKQIDRAATESLDWPNKVRRYFTVWR
jgi:hypothetical protein